MPGESYCRHFQSLLLCSSDAGPLLYINSVYWFLSHKSERRVIMQTRTGTSQVIPLALWQSAVQNAVGVYCTECVFVTVSCSASCQCSLYIHVSLWQSVVQQVVGVHCIYVSLCQSLVLQTVVSVYCIHVSLWQSVVQHAVGVYRIHVFLWQCSTASC